MPALLVFSILLTAVKSEVYPRHLTTTPCPDTTDPCTSCPSASYPSGTSCVSCPQGCTQCISASSCSSCSNGYCLNQNTCTACPQSCTQCTSDTICSSCATGYYLSQTSCTACPQSCTQCSSASSCSSCSNGYYLNQNTCTACPQSCTQCSAATTCSVCNNGYYLNQASCTACPQSCTKCTSDTICSSCATGYYLSQTSCTACPQICTQCSNASSCSACINGYYLNQTSCTACPQSCTQCSAATTCSACNAGYYLNQNICTACPQICTQCSNASSCSACINGYYLNQTSCIACPQSCTQCSAATTCSVCNNGYYLNQTSCNACPQSCTKCTSDTICSSCSPGYYLNQTTCSPCLQGCTQCNSTSFCSSCQSNYYPKNNACLKCGNLCNTCNESGCLNCQSSTYTISGVCYACIESKLISRISGPTQYSTACSSLTYDNSLSTYNSSQPVQFFWTVIQLDPNNNTILSLNFSTPSISPEIANVTSTLIVNLTLSICTQSNQSSLTTSIVTSPYVQIVPQFNNYVSVFPAQPVLLKTSIGNYCGITGSVTWTWTGGVSGSGNEVLISNLPVGVYNQSVIAHYSNFQSFYNFTLEVVRNEIVIIFSRSSGLAAFNEDFNIDASQTYGMLGNVSNYQWSCLNVSSKLSCADSAGNALNFSNKNSFHLNQVYLSNNLDLDISLNVITNTQSKTLNVLIHFQNITEKIEVVQSTAKLNYAADNYILVSGNTAASVLWTSSVSIPVTNILSLWIPPGLMTQQSSYSFQLSISNVQYVSTTLYINYPPTCQSPFQLASSSFSLSAGVRVLSVQCSDPDNFPIRYNLNYSTPDYPLINTSIILPIGLSALVLVACDSLNACTELSFNVSISLESLSDSQISSLYSSYSGNLDLVPLTIIAIGNSLSVPASLFSNMLSDLLKFSSSFPNSQIAVLNALSALTSPVQADSLLTTNYNQITNLLTAASPPHFNKALQTTYTIKVNSNLARLKSSTNLQSSLPLFLSSLQKLSQNFYPGQVLNVSNPEFSFFKSCKFGSQYSSFQYLSDGRNVTFPANLTLDPNSVVNLYCVILKNKGNYSDLIDISFTKSGDLVNSTLVTQPETMVNLSKLAKPVTVTVRFQKQVLNQWACAYLINNDWLSSGCKFIQNDSNSLTFITNHTSMFSMFDTSEVKLPPVQFTNSTAGCGTTLNAIWILVVIGFIYIIFIPIIWFLDRGDSKDLKKNTNYDNIKKSETEREPSIASPSFSEEFPNNNNNNLSSDYAIQYPKSQPRKHWCKLLIEGHLLLGLPVYRTEFTRVLRFSTICVVLIFELLLEGLFFSGFEDTSTGSSASSSTYFSNYTGDYFGYMILSLVVALVFQLSLIILFSLKDNLRTFGVASGVSLIIVCLIGSIAGIIILSLRFCPNWSGYWGISFLCSTILEVLIVQTLVMVIRFTILKCRDS